MRSLLTLLAIALTCTSGIAQPRDARHRSSVTGVKYAFRDLFSDTVAASSVNGSSSVPGPGTRSISGDTDGIVSIGPAVTILAIGDSKTAANYQYWEGLGSASTRYVPIGTNIAKGGWTLLDVATNVENGGLSPYTIAPAAILLGIGINSIALDQNTWESQYARIVDALHARWPSAYVYCAQVWGTNRTAACVSANTWTTNVASTRPWMRWSHNEQDWFQGSWNGSVYVFDSGDGTGLHPSVAGYCRQRDITTGILDADVASGVLVPTMQGLVSRYPTNDFSPTFSWPSITATQHSVWAVTARNGYVSGYARFGVGPSGSTRFGWVYGPNSVVYDGTTVTVGPALSTFSEYTLYTVTRSFGSFLLIQGGAYTYPTLLWVTGQYAGTGSLVPTAYFFRYGHSTITKARCPSRTFDISPIVSDTWTGTRTGLGSSDGLTLGAQETSTPAAWSADASWTINGGTGTNTVGDDVTKQTALVPCAVNDVIASAAITYVAGGTNHAGLIVGYSSASQWARAYLSNNVARLDVCVSGNVTNLVSAAYTYAAGTNLTVIWRPPTEARLVYGKTAAGSSTSAALSAFTSGTTHAGLVSSGSGTRFGPVAVWACGGDGRYSGLSRY